MAEIIVFAHKGKVNWRNAESQHTGFNFDKQICTGKQLQTVLTELTFEGKESQRAQNEGTYHNSWVAHSM